MADTDLIHENQRRLSRAQAEALIGQRLAALGHAPGFISAGAVDEIIARGSGSPGQIRMALSATLFLASTEDLPFVAAEDVCRAVPALPEPSAVEPAGSRPRKAPGFQTLVLAAFAFGMLVAPHPVCDLKLAGQMPRAAIVAEAPPHIEYLQARQLHEAPAPALVARTAEQSVPPAEKPAPPDLPLAPPASVVLLLPRYTAPDPVRLAAIYQALSEAGFNDVRELTIRTRRACRSVCYFFSGDADLAARVAAVIGSAPSASDPQNPVLTQNPPGTTLLIQHPERPFLPPGSIFVTVR